MMMLKKPAVKKRTLIIISGLIWTGIGVLLLTIASQWFPLFTSSQTIFALSVGLPLGISIAWFGFRGLAKKNAKRISAYPEYVCVFAFQRWQMYFLVGFMIGLGIFMRHSAWVPKYLLAPIYIGFGSALFLASFVYYKHVKTAN